MFLFTNRSSPITITRPDAQTLKEVARLSALADDFNSERLGLKALLREQGQELADWARHWAWVTAQWGRRQAYLWWALGYKEPPRSRAGLGRRPVKKRSGNGKKFHERGEETETRGLRTGRVLGGIHNGFPLKGIGCKGPADIHIYIYIYI